MTWRDVRDALDRGCDCIVVPFGAVEQHGSHLPLETDAMLGDYLGPQLAERLYALCAPTVPIGCSEHHMGHAGTLSLQPDTLRLIVRDLVDSLARHGFRTIVLLPTHAGNAEPLTHAARELDPASGVRVVAVADMEALAGALHAAYPGGAVLEDAIAHAGEIETSLMLALAPAAVRASSDEGARGLPRGTDDVRRAMEAAGRSYVTAFLDECVRQLETQGIVRCASG
jgi:creatinine amidohydrolase